jgi:hypothetical protein
MLKRWIEVRTQNTAWLIDLEFLLSSYECQWGRGCKGINQDAPDLGCCANGAYLTEGDEALVREKVALLTPDIWQHYGADYLEPVREKNRIGLSKKVGYKTALVDPDNPVSGCVFANRTGWGGQVGCAFHIAAERAGEDYRDWKPEICWQMPLLADYSDELEMHILRMFHWSKDDYDWFCSQDEVAWVADKPLYLTMENELKRLVESIDVDAYALIRSVCEAAHKQLLADKPEKKRVPFTIGVQ